MERETVNWYEQAARKKLSLPPEWQAWKWEAIGFPHTKDVLVYLGVPRLLKSGKHKGLRTWRDSKETRKCVITEADEQEAYADYERSGKCFACFGTGEAWGGWNHLTGNRYIPCRRCGATGKPLPLK